MKESYEVRPSQSSRPQVMRVRRALGRGEAFTQVQPGRVLSSENRQDFSHRLRDAKSLVCLLVPCTKVSGSAWRSRYRSSMNVESGIATIRGSITAVSFNCVISSPNGALLTAFSMKVRSASVSRSGSILC
jgi:hypothetical protein